MTYPAALAVAPTAPVAAVAIGGLVLSSRARLACGDAAFGVAATAAVAYSFPMSPSKGERAQPASTFSSFC